MENVIAYYDKNAEQFCKNTLGVDFLEVQTKFCNKLPIKAKILDFGCGSGRDTKYFISQGFDVDAMDGSIELCKRASEYTGIAVKNLLFQELDAVEEYDGIWACSSILHLPKTELKSVMNKMMIAVKKNGIIYTSFKYGSFEGERNGRYFTDFTLEDFQMFLSDLNVPNTENLNIEEWWISEDVRPDRSNEKWLNLILRRI